MAQQVARAEITPHPPAAYLAAVHDLDGLGRDWTVLKGCRLRPSERGSSPTVLIHPGQGIAVLDVAPSETPDAVDAVRARLDAARFEGIFAGHLPVVHLRVAPRQTPFLPKLLDDAFAALPPLSLPGGDAWAGVASRALLAEQPAAPRVAIQPVRGVVEGGGRRLRTRRRRRRGAGLRRAGALLLCLAALGGVLALVAKDLPAVDAFMRGIVVLPVAEVAPAVPPPPSERPASREAVALPAPAPEPARIAPAPPAALGGGATTPIPPALSTAPPAAEASTPAATQAAAGPQPQSRRPEASPPQARRPPERAAPPQQQRRQQQQEAVAEPPPAGGDAATSSESASQRCSRVASRVGRGAPIGDADMRFFNQACIRW